MLVLLPVAAFLDVRWRRAPRVDSFSAIGLIAGWWWPGKFLIHGPAADVARWREWFDARPEFAG